MARSGDIRGLVITKDVGETTKSCRVVKLCEAARIAEMNSILRVLCSVLAIEIGAFRKITTGTRFSKKSDEIRLSGQSAKKRASSPCRSFQAAKRSWAVPTEIQ